MSKLELHYTVQFDELRYYAECHVPEALCPLLVKKDSELLDAKAVAIWSSIHHIARCSDSLRYGLTLPSRPAMPYVSMGQRNMSTGKLGGKLSGKVLLEGSTLWLPEVVYVEKGVIKTGTCGSIVVRYEPESWEQRARRKW